MKKCPYCARDVENDALFCRFCGKEQQPPATSDNKDWSGEIAQLRSEVRTAQMAASEKKDWPGEIAQLRAEVRKVQAAVKDVDDYVIALEHRTDLLSTSRLSRIFTTWGYYVLAQLMISAAIGIVVVVLLLLAMR
jgi:hypothetical protein